MMTAAVLREMAAAAAKRAGVCCMIDVKPQLYWLELSEEDGIFDAAIAAYLINPLKDSYTYDGIAQRFPWHDSAFKSGLDEEDDVDRSIGERKTRVLDIILRIRR